MIARPAGRVRYLADENAIGLAKVLLRDYGRTDVTHIGHPGLPQIPRGSPDLQWLPIAGRKRWIVLTRDRRIKSRPAELLTFAEHGVRLVWVGGKQDHTSGDLAAIFVAHQARLDRLITKMGAGPWALSMTPTGVRELRYRRPNG